MSTLEDVGTLSTADTPVASLSGRWQRIGDWLERAGEWLNPLLVKECRQALKSRQFALTFTLVVVLCWIWSIARIASFGPDVGRQPVGPDLFYGYYFILSLALLIIVPYSAFRSLIAEQEDNTFELVAITNLRPRQIVGGKVGSAMVQMIVYLSAIAPCLAFTYLLRGIDVITICYLLFYTFLASLGLSLAGLFLATIATEKHWQIIISVAIAVGLFFTFTGALQATFGVLRFARIPFYDVDFWISNLAFLTLYFSTFAIIYLAAGAQLTFTADNRSRPLRIAMLVQHVLFAGWVGYAIAKQWNDRMADLVFGITIIAYATIAILYWYAMGAFMSGESPELSLRVQRGLPKTFFGRIFLTWFNPGPGTGFLYALANALGAAVLTVVAASVRDSYAPQARSSTSGTEQLIQFLIIAISYVTVYLGITNLLLRALRRISNVTIALSVLLNCLLVLAGMGIPAIIQMSSNDFNQGYSLLHITNPFWSTGLVIQSSHLAPTIVSILLIMVPTALVVFILNLLFVVPSVLQVRIAKPRRVAEEDAAAAQAIEPATSQPSSPWDE